LRVTQYRNGAQVRQPHGVRIAGNLQGIDDRVHRNQNDRQHDRCDGPAEPRQRFGRHDISARRGDVRRDCNGDAPISPRAEHQARDGRGYCHRESNHHHDAEIHTKRPGNDQRTRGRWDKRVCHRARPGSNQVFQVVLLRAPIH
jgi:hypothetical protein